MRKLQCKDALTISREEVERRFKKAKEEYRTACKNSKDLRDTFKLSLDEATAEKNQTTIQTEKKKRLTIERQREAGRAISTLKRREKPKVTKVYTTTEGSRIECSKKEDIEQACITENLRRFSQTNSSPPMQTYITERVGVCAELETADNILLGTDDSNWVENKYLKLVLMNMRNPNSVIKMGDISTEITHQEH